MSGGKERVRKRTRVKIRKMGNRAALSINLPQEIGYTHMRLTEGVDSQLQLSGLLARLCLKSVNPS